MPDPAAPNLPGYTLAGDARDAAQHRVLTYRSADALPVPTPTPTPTPAPVTMAWKIAPPLAKRGDGFSFINRPGPVVLRDTGVRGFEQNLVVQNAKGLTLDNVVSLNAHKN